MKELIDRNRTMLWLGVTVILLGIHGCQCDHEMPCGKAFLDINYVGYDLTTLDTVILRRFDKSTLGNRLKDSIVVSRPEHIRYRLQRDTAVWVSTNLSGFPFFSLQSDWNYEVFIPAARRIYQITDIVEEQRTMDEPCFDPTMVKRYCMNSIRSVTLDNRLLPVDKFNTIYLNK